MTSVVDITNLRIDASKPATSKSKHTFEIHNNHLFYTFKDEVTKILPLGDKTSYSYFKGDTMLSLNGTSLRYSKELEELIFNYIKTKDKQCQTL